MGMGRRVCLRLYRHSWSLADCLHIMKGHVIAHFLRFFFLVAVEPESPFTVDCIAAEGAEEVGMSVVGG